MDPKETQPFLVGPEKTTTEAERGGLTPTPTGTGNESVFRVGVASTRLNRAVREWQRRNAREFVKGNARARVGLKSPDGISAKRSNEAPNRRKSCRLPKKAL
jgi:hypothetical protein